MSVSKTCVGGLTLRCVGALGVGLAVVIAITGGLLFISGDGDNASSTRVAAYTLKFPEDEQMLKDLSAQILKDSNLASAKKAADIQPAAGSSNQAKSHGE